MVTRCALSLIALLVCQSGWVAAEGTPVAQQRFTAGRQLYDAGDFAGALVAFRSSFSAQPSPNTALYLGRCLRHLGRLADAVAQYERTAALARSAGDRRYEATASSALAEARELEPRIARLTLRLPGAPAGTRVRFPGATIAARASLSRLPVDAGHLVLRVEAPGMREVTATVDLAAGTERELEVRLRPAVGPGEREQQLIPPAPPPRPLRRQLRVAALATAGVSAASFAAAIVCWRLAGDRFAELQRSCDAGPCPESLRPTLDQGRGYQTATNVTLGAGIALAVTGAALLVSSWLVERRVGSARWGTGRDQGWAMGWRFH